METIESCNCKTGCTTRRCPCLRADEPCGDECGCRDCRNPLNGVDVERLSLCAIRHVALLRKMSAEELDRTHDLPCGCREVPLRDLLDDYTCPGCNETYWYSFCWEEVVQDSCSWHCEICNECRDWREWHCEQCNRCTYGVTFPCEHCGAEGAMSDLV